MARVTTKAATSYYVDGNTVRKTKRKYVDDRRVRSDRKRKSLDAKQEKLIRRHKLMSTVILIFMVAALSAAGLILYVYIYLQSEITSTIKNISYMEQELNELTLENNEAYNRISGNIDLEEIKRIAIQEYGMRYVQQGQIVTYTDGGGNDYVRQMKEISENAN